jgi:hypothetical protein
MNVFIQKNRGWLMFYALGARVVGWVLIILTCIPICLIPYLVWSSFEGRLVWLGTILELLLGRLPLGIILLGVAQLIKCLSEDEYQPAWLLRHGAEISYLFAVLIAAGSVGGCFFYLQDARSPESFSVFMRVLPAIVNTLIFVGLGNLLKRILPIIEESKVLV